MPKNLMEQVLRHLELCDNYSAPQAALFSCQIADHIVLLYRCKGLINQKKFAADDF
jgi:hypothetical protein